MSEVFNLVWVNPQPADDRSFNVAYGVTNTIVVPTDVEAVILFPSLMTPFVYHEKAGDPWIEVLIASNTVVTARHVNRQLKVYRGLDADKRYHREWLFPAIGDDIVIEPAPKDGHIVRTHQKFEGVLHEYIDKRLRNAGFTKLFRLKFHERALLQSTATHTLRPDEEKDNTHYLAERCDFLIRDMLKMRSHVPGYNPLPEDGCFAFKVDPQHGPQQWLNRNEPIVAYHPVYRFRETEPEHFNFGHLTDIHLNNRLEILKHSPAQVIVGVSRPIGQLLQSTNQSFTDLLNQVAHASDAHVLAIGGDLIDHHLNAYHPAAAPTTMEGVWDAIDLDGRAARNYRPCVDIIGFYSLITDFIRRSQKPVFGIAGNHDAYLDPFGISPRLLGVRANAGIPADLNLTLYEAILAFGPRFANFNVHVSPPSSFDGEWMEWFYTVFTPFGEASVQLAQQRLVCLGWGGTEDMQAGGQGEGIARAHLPRADEAVSEVQLKLLQNATSNGVKHPVVLLTHFTVASFEERIAMLSNGAPTTGALQTDGDEDFFNMGTFEKNHGKFLQVLQKGGISCILTGHSHRRGLYFLGDAEIDLHAGRASFPVTIHEPEGFKIATHAGAATKSAIIVSDSGGPYPRHNYNGEFNGWGSDKPAGSIVRFDTDGRLKEVEVIRAKVAKPRLAVALDYLDVERQMVWERPIRTKPFRIQAERDALSNGFKGGFYELEVPLHRAAWDMGLRVGKIQFYVAKSPMLSVTVNGARSVKLDLKLSEALYKFVRESVPSEAFLQVTFDWSVGPAGEQVIERYDTESPWIFEVVPERLHELSSRELYYSFARPLRRLSLDFGYSDLPDFKHRAPEYREV